MRSHRSLAAAICVVALAASACGPSSATRSSQGATATPSGSATIAPSASASDDSFYLRWWTTAPGGIDGTFASVPVVVSDGKMLSVNYPEEVQVYPLFAQPVSQTITDAGIAMIVDEARRDGLIGATTKLECPHAPNAEQLDGASTSHLVLIVDGETHELTASCNYAQPTPAPGEPQPATWDAFQRFEHLMSDPASWLGAALGPETPYDPQILAVLAMSLPDDVEVPDNPAQWPLAPFASFGTAIDNNGSRCAMVGGADATALLAVIKPLPQETIFVDDDNDVRTLVVRAVMPGEPDLCSS